MKYSVNIKIFNVLKIQKKLLIYINLKGIVKTKKNVELICYQYLFTGKLASIYFNRKKVHKFILRYRLYVIENVHIDFKNINKI